MNEGWTETRLADHIGLAKGLSYRSSFFDEAGDALLNLKCITPGGGFNPTGVKYYAGAHKPEHVVRPGDIVLALTDLTQHGEVMGRPAYVPLFTEREMIASLDLARVMLNSKDIHPRFLYYRLRGHDYLSHVTGRATGTTVRHLASRDILDFRFQLPALHEQEAIASVLGALDDKIELNRRMNETLEGIARALFRSWFVDFDPVRAKAEGREMYGVSSEAQALFPDALEDSSVGFKPVSWPVASLPELFDVNPRRVLPKGQMAPYLDMANMPTSSARAQEVYERPFGSGTKFVDGDTLVARITPCLENGKTAFVDFLGSSRVGWGSTEYIILRPKPPLPPEYAYFLARTDSFRRFAISNMTGTSGRQRVPASALNHFDLVVPPPAIADRFGSLARTVLSRMKANDEQSRTLADLRDALLPKLLSGKLRVTDAERLVGAST